MSTQPSERAAVIATIDPQTVVNSELFSDVIDCKLWHEVMGVALLGNVAAETIDFRVCTCDSDGSNPTTLKASTQLAAHASNNDNKQLVLNVLSSALLATNKRYVKFGLVTGGASGGPACVVALGMKPRYGPASDNDLSSVAEIK